MCHYIAATLAPGADIDAVRATAIRHKRILEPLDNDQLRRQLEPGETAYITTRGHCDCGTALGERVRLDVERDATDEERLVRKARRLRRAGWSEAKVARWLEQREHAGTRRHDAVDAGRSGPRGDELDRWKGLLREAVPAHARWMGLLVHFFDDAWHDEPIELVDRQGVALSDLDDDLLLGLRDDILYRFRPRAGGPRPAPGVSA